MSDFVLSTLRLNHEHPKTLPVCPQAGCKFRGTLEEIRGHLGVSPAMPPEMWQEHTRKYPHKPHDVEPPDPPA